MTHIVKTTRPGPLAIATFVAHRDNNTRKRKSKLDDPLVRKGLLFAASNGMSRAGAAASVGVTAASLKNWLDRGAAQPKVEPYGTFVLEYRANERMMEVFGASAINAELVRISELAMKKVPLDGDERRFLQTQLAQRYPQDHGIGTNSGREIDGEPDGDAWLQEHGLQEHQLRAMFNDPPEEVATALHLEAENIVERFLEAGWRPTDKQLSVMLAPTHPHANKHAPAWDWLRNHK